MAFSEWILSRYPQVRNSMSDSSKPRFDILFIDLNTVVSCAFKCVRCACPSLESCEEWKTKVVHMIHAIVHVVRPSKLIYIVADGAVPLGVLRQRKWALPEGDALRASAAAGTAFCAELDVDLREFIGNEVTANALWGRPAVVYDSYLSPGESAQKLSDLVTKMRKDATWSEHATVVYCADRGAGLVDLLSLNISNSCLMAPVGADFYSERDFELIWIGVVRECLQLDFDRDHDFVLKDLAVLAFFTGSAVSPGFADVAFAQVADAYRANAQILVDRFSFLKTPFVAFLERLVGEVYGEEEEAPDAAPDDARADAAFAALYFHLSYARHIVPSWTWTYPYRRAPTLRQFVAKFKATE
jgi:hypothetical protein